MANKKDQRMTFDRIRDIEEQQLEDQKKRHKLQERAKEAAAKVELLKKQYNEALKNGVENNEDNTEELDKIDQQLEEVKKVAARRANEEDIARKHYQTTINQDVVKAEFSEWKKEYFDKEVKPELERINDLKHQLTEAHMDYKDAVRWYEAEKNRTISTIDPADKIVFDVLGGIQPQDRRELNKWFITVETLQDLERGRIPNGVELDEGGRN